MSKKFKVGVIGCGYWGPNLIRVFSQHEDCTVVKCCDIKKNRLKFIQKRYSSVDVTTEYKDVVEDSDIDIVAIATPASTHFCLAKEALKNGKHILIEKPMVSSTEEAKQLVGVAKKRKKIICVDHTFIYTGAVRKIKEIISKGELGRIMYYDSVRINLGLFQHDINVVWDLGSHDISIMDFLLGEKPIEVSAIGMGHVHNDIENIAYISVMFNNNLLAHFHVNWLAPVKIRKTFIGGTKKMLVYDDLEGGDKIKVYDRGVTVRKNPKDIHKLLIGYRFGSMYSPFFDLTEALVVECGHFIDCIKQSKAPITDGLSGLRVVKILEAADRSLKNNGKSQKIE